MTRPVKSKFFGEVPVFYDRDTGEHILPMAPLSFYDDFVGAGAITIPAAGSPESGMDWVKKLVGTGTATVGGASNGLNGYIALALNATSEKGEGSLYMNDQRQFDPTKGLVFEARFNNSVLPTGTAVAVIGVAGTWVDNPDAVIRSAWFKINTGGTVLVETDDSSTDTSASTGVVLGTGDWKIGRIDMTNPADVRFYLDGVDVTPSGTTFAYAATGATGQVQPYASVYKSAGTGVATLNVDFVRLYQQSRA